MLEARAVTRSFQGRPVLGPLDLDLAGGERLALTGPNGAGKSTLLRMVVGTLAPSSGTVRVAGHRAGSRAARQCLGVSFAQERSFYQRLTGLENLRVFASMRMRRRRADAAVARIVEELELPDIAARRLDRCSSGMVQQLAIARALLGAPSLLVLDEPTRSLDAAAVERLWAAIERRRALTLVIATHRKEDVERCERQLDLAIA